MPLWNNPGWKEDLDSGADLNLDLFSSLPAMSVCSRMEHILIVVKNLTIMTVSYWTEI